MKKLFTLLSALLCAWSIQAQTLTFHHEGQDIENGSTFYSMDYNEIIFGFGNLTFTPEIYLRGDETRTVHVRVESLDECAVWAFCAFDGSCINTLESTNYVAEKTSILIDANTGNRGDANLQLECILGKVDATQTYTRRLLVSAWYEGEENNKVSFTLVVTTDESLLSIDDVQASKAHVAMQGNVMHYVERNLFAGKLGISQKKIAASTVFEVFTLVSAAFLIGITVSFGQLQSAFYSVFGENYIRIIVGVIVAGIACVIVAGFIFKKKLVNMLAEYKLSDFLLTYIGNVLLYMIVLITLGSVMVVLYCYMGGTFQLRSAALIVSGFTIAWVLGFIVPGAPGGIGVRELVITLLLSSVVGESLIVTLSVTHRLITIVGDFMAYLVMLIIRWRFMEPDNG